MAGMVWPGPALRDARSPQPIEVAPAEHSYAMASEASSDSSGPSVLGHSYDDSSGILACELAIAVCLAGETSDSSDEA